MGFFRHGHIRRFLERQLIKDTSRTSRVTVLKVLGAIGIADDLEYAVGVAAPGGRPLSGRVRSALTQAIERVLRRDPAAFRAAERFLFAPRPTAGGAFVRAIGATGGPEEMAMLARLLSFSSAHDTVVIAAIGQIGRRSLHPLDASVLERVREFLGANDVQVVREAVLACGNLEDYGAIGPLIDRLAHEDDSVRMVTRWALKRITGVSFGSEVRSWQRWLEEETAWFENEARPRMDALEESDDSARIGEALGALAVRRFRRDEIAIAMTAALEHESPEVRRLVCDALRQLGSTAGVLSLVDALEDHDEGVVNHAWAALKALTGRDHPRDPEAWRTEYRSTPRPTVLAASRG
jgi:hypothetical protein